MWFPAADTIAFSEGGSEAMRIDSSGNVLVGSTSYQGSASSGTGGQYIGTAGSATAFARNSANVVYVNRIGSDGNVIGIRKNGTDAGGIGTAGGGALYMSDAVYGGLAFSVLGAGDINPCNTTGGVRDNAMDLGQPTARFKDIYLGGGAYIGGTAAANKLDDYEEGTFTPTYAAASGSVTMVATTGNYVKVGKIVHIQIRLMTSAETLSGDVTVTGLPFTSDSTSNHQTVLSAQGVRFITDMPNLSAYIFNNVTEIILDKSATTAVSNSYVNGTDMLNSTNYNILKIAGSYEVN